MRLIGFIAGSRPRGGCTSASCISRDIADHSVERAGEPYTTFRHSSLELGQARYIIPHFTNDFDEVPLIILFHVRLLGGLYFSIRLYGIPIRFCAGI